MPQNMPVRDHNRADTDPASAPFWLSSGMSAKYIELRFPNNNNKKIMDSIFTTWKTYSKSSSAAPKTKLRLNKIYERTA